MARQPDHTRDFFSRRLHHQRIVQSTLQTPAEVVSHLGAMQAQDYGGAKWSIGLRLPASADAEIESAIAERKIVRTWPQRGTLHFVAAEDVRWMLALLAPRNIAGSMRRRLQLELDDEVLHRSFDVLTRALQGGTIMSRPDVMALLEKSGIPTGGNRGYHIFWQAAIAGLICFGPPQGKQHSFVLLEEWVPAAKHRIARDEALAALAMRYFTSRGPASLRDFLWWSGLTAADARLALELAKPNLVSETIDGAQYWLSASASAHRTADGAACLLPGFDEYLLGYSDRSAVLDAAHAQRIVPGNNGVFMPTIIVNGRVAGMWKRTVTAKTAVIELSPFIHLTKAQLRAIDESAARFSTFTGRPHTIVISP